MKVKYIGGESAIGSRETLAYGRKWVIGEVVDMASLDETYVKQFGAKIAKHPAFEVVEAAPKADASVVAEAFQKIEENFEELNSEIAPAPKPRKKKVT